MKKWGEVVGIVLSIIFSGCASMSEVDRSHVNRPSMDLRTRQTPAQAPSLTNLGSLQRGTSGGSCSTRAH